MGLAFEWDGRKATQNLKKHGVSFEEASTAFGDLESRTIPDPIHSSVETRFITLGKSERERLLVVVTTERGNRIRIISARRASRREKDEYEKGR
jgi:hypothetical protein